MTKLGGARPKYTQIESIICSHESEQKKGLVEGKQKRREMETTLTRYD